MAISPYFKHITSGHEEKLIDELTREVIYQRGLNFWYIPREYVGNGPDYLFGENPENKYVKAVEIEMWCENVDGGFEGEQSIISRFGLSINDNASFIVSKTRFTQEVTPVYNEIIRPREGDLVAFPMTKSIFEIKFVEHEQPFYQIGKSHVYRLETEKFNWSHEDIETTVEDIDNLVNIPDYTENTEIQTESDTFMDHTEKDPWSEGSY